VRYNYPMLNAHISFTLQGSRFPPMEGCPVHYPPPCVASSINSTPPLSQSSTLA
jgi:hypothetical protein